MSGLDAKGLIERLRKNGVELYPVPRDGLFEVGFRGPSNILTERMKAAISLNAVEISRILMKERIELRAQEADENLPHAWLVRRGSPPLLACGSVEWINACMSAISTSQAVIRDKWVVFKSEDVGPLVKDDLGGYSAPAIKAPKGLAAAGPTAVPGVVLSVCRACRVELEFRDAKGDK